MRGARVSGALALLALLVAVPGCESPAVLTSPFGSATNGPATWSDEFEGAAGSLPDAKKWSFDVGTGWGNAQLEFDTARSTNASLDGAGHLAIVARKESYGGSAYTSARIKTQALFSQNGGRFEARMQLPAGRGLWPAFWLLGSDVGSNPWPACGEIDIMEYRGQEPSVVHGSVHGPGYSGGGAITKAYTLPNATFAAGFHTFAVDWTATKIAFSVDGYVYETITPANLPSGSRWVFDHPFFIILNLAVGGNYVGSPDANTAFPATMLVDYVRVYSL